MSMNKDFTASPSRRRAVRGATAAILLAVAGAAQAAPAGEVPLAAPGAPSLAEMVAAAFSRAALASARGDDAQLSVELRQIAAIGARPLVVDADPVRNWRTLARMDSVAPMRGSPLGPGYRAGQVDPGSQERFEQLFLSGRKASIALSSPGNAPLALTVLDANRKPVCEARDARLACHWMPLFTQRYTIEVRNKGAQTADYFLVVE
ncbi:hypothetical protein [Novosphingobium colocasiae]|uniref:Uncharacterized protein n=1 Tax=Novosphingobium colocasiae TaxID=1256513 RepID=A0A918PD29_9SPHN|nr:hypothetical protein [Novosphingobium colocasiae]GGY99963.1 hypothetical protein GCM10011614_13720 [Novosphingobium colocasiae]